jgi:hypothetical protein
MSGVYAAGHPAHSRNMSAQTRALFGATLTPSRGAGRDPRYDARASTSIAADAVVHVWEASDDSWRNGVDLERPIDSGTESFVAGTASCPISVERVDELSAELRPRDVLHSVSHTGVWATDLGTRDGNLISFCQWFAQ